MSGAGAKRGPGGDERRRPPQAQGVLPSQAQGGLPSQAQGGLPPQAQGGLPPQAQGGLPSQAQGGLVPLVLPVQSPQILPVNGQQLQPLRIGAVAGGGIGGDEEINNARIALQLEDVEGLVPQVEARDEVALRELQAIRGRIQEANDRRELFQHQLLLLEQNNRARRALVNDVRCLLPGELGMTARARQAVGRQLVPLVDTFYDAFRPFLTEPYDDVAVFRECFQAQAAADGNLTQDEELLRTSFELLMKESILQGISAPQLALDAFTQLLFNNQVGRMMVSAGGSIVAIILARDILLMFANTVIGVMTFGWLDLQQLTNLFGFVYHNCSLANIRNLLIYLNVTRENADLFILAIRQYNREQRQYILMSLFLFGLNSIGRGARYTVDQITQILDIANRYLNGVFNADLDVAVPPGQAPLNQAAAAADLNAAAAAAAQPNIAPVPPANPHPTIFQIFLESGTDILTFIHRVFRSGWARGLRISRQCLREVFTLYLVRPPAGQGLVCDLVNGVGSVTRWGVEAIQARSAQLDPDRPNQEVVRLLAAVKGLGGDVVIDPVRCEAVLYEFSQELKGFTGAPETPHQSRGAVKILQQTQEDDRELVYLTREHLTALRTHFCQDYEEGRRGVVNAERLQQACLGMRLFVFEQDMRENMVAANVVNAVERQRVFDFNNTQDAVQSVSQSLGRIQDFILEDNETRTKSIFQKAKLRLQALANIEDNAIRIMAVAGGFQEPPAHPRVVLARNRRRNRIPSKADIRSAVLHSINSRDGTNEETKQLIREMLIPRIDDINFQGLEAYLLEQNPRLGIPDTFLNSFRAFLDSPIRAQIPGALEAISAATRSGLSRCAALCTNVVVVSAGAAHATAITGVQRVRGLFNRIVRPQAVIDAGQAAVAAAAGGPPPLIEPNSEAAILVNIDNVARVDRVEPVVPLSPAHDGLGAHNQGGGRSRKRSASKRTRRKGKQSSKKLKSKSRRYQRRASSRKSLK